MNHLFSALVKAGRQHGRQVSGIRIDMTAGESSCQPGEAPCFCSVLIATTQTPLQEPVPKRDGPRCSHSASSCGRWGSAGPATQLRVANASFIPVRFFIIYCVANAFPVVPPRYLDALLLYIFPSPLPLVCIPTNASPATDIHNAASRDRFPSHSPTTAPIPRRLDAASCSHVTILPCQ